MAAEAFTMTTHVIADLGVVFRLSLANPLLSKLPKSICPRWNSSNPGDIQAKWSHRSVAGISQNMSGLEVLGIVASVISRTSVPASP
jgi:hypothetical protein